MPKANSGSRSGRVTKSRRAATALPTAALRPGGKRNAHGRGLRSLLLATTAFAALAPALPAAAQNAWTGANSTDWFDGGNWSVGAPTLAEIVEVNTITPAPVVSFLGGFAGQLYVGLTGTGGITIAGGGSLHTNTTYLAYNLTGMGTILVTGNGSAFSNAFDLYVGFQNHAVLTVEAGGAVTTARDAILGQAPNGNGVVNVSGANSSWTVNGSLSIGNFGKGALGIATGGSVNSADATIGVESDSEGAANVAGGTWTSTGQIVVGGAGAGTLDVTAGGVVSSASSVIGNAASGTGEATVSGAGSSWTTTGLMTIGAQGSGQLTIANGGAVLNNDDVMIGDSGTGQITVTGANSTWTVTGSNVILGNGGSGSARVEAGGVVQTRDVSLGQLPAIGSGNVEITGATSRWDSSGEFAIGRSGSGTMTVLDGAKVTSNTLELGYNQTGVGTLTISGAGSSWTNTHGGYIGRDGVGFLQIEAGGTLNVGSLAFAGSATSQGTGLITGIGSSLNATNGLTIGDGGTGSLTISAGGAVTSGSASLTGGFGGTAVVTVTGAGSSWTNAALFNVGGNGTGTLNVEAGGKVTTQHALLGGSNQGVGLLNVNGVGSSFLASGDMLFGDEGTGALSITSGGIVGAQSVGVANELGSSGSISVSGAGSSLSAPVNLLVGVRGNGVMFVEAGGTLSSGTTFLGAQAGSIGEARVTGQGSSWLNSADLNIGGGGTGVLTVANDGKVAVNGTTNIAAVAGSTGTLIIGAAKGLAAAAPGSFTAGAIAFGAGNGRIIFNHTSEAYQFAAAMTGAGTLEAMSGTTVLSGNSSGFAGNTTVSGGTLVVNGALGGTLDVLAGARLQGSGAVGVMNIQAGATIAPGNSIGTLSVNGNLVLAPGSIYAAEIAGGGASDRIAATGQATVTGGQVTVSAIDPQTSYVNGQRYTILTAAGGVAGNFASPTTQSAFLDVSLDHRTNQVDLVIAVKGSDPGPGPDPDPAPTPAPAVFGTVAQTRNQFATAGGLDTLPQLGDTLALYNSLLMLDAPSARGALDLLSGEIHASAKTALVEESWLLRSAANDRLRSAFGAVGAAPMATMNYGFSADLAPSVKGPMPPMPRSDRFAVWGQGYGSWGRTDSDGNAAKLTRSAGGLVVGADAAVFDTMRFGMIAGYSHSEFDAKGRLSSGKSDNYHLGLYGGGQWGGLGLRTGASYTWHDVETNRTVAFAGFGDGLKADYNAGTAQVFGELGYRVDLGKVAFEPFAGLAYVNLHTDGFRETGGAAALTARGDDTNIGYSTLGLRASTSADLQGMALTLRGTLAWRHAFGDVTPLATLAFSGSSAFSVAGVPIARNAALLEAGLDLAISQTATLGLSYTGQLASDAQDHAFKGNLAVRF